VVSSLHANSDEVGHSGGALEDEWDLALAGSLVSAGMIADLSYREQLGQNYQSEHYKAKIEAL